MLDRFPVNPILPAQDGDRARSFYRDVLGLTLASGPTDDPMMFTAAGGTSIVLTELPDRLQHHEAARLVQPAPTFEHLPGAASFAGQAGARHGEVMDFGAVKSAWLKDTEGNVLALNELVGR